MECGAGPFKISFRFSRKRAIIHIENLSVSYGPVAALDDICLDISEGECVLVSGPSGCGKSTLGRVMCGLIPHAIPAQVSGKVRVAGLDALAHPIPEIAQQVGMVFQRPASQLFHLRVEDEVAFGARNLGLPENEIAERTAWALQATGLLDLRGERPSTLSGGQKQCVAIAAALAMCTQVLVLDEPTASLDVPNTRRVIDTLAALQHEYGITIVLIEHRLAEAAQLAQRVILMEDGRIHADGLPLEIFANRELRDRLGLRRPTEEPSVAWDRLIQSNGNHIPGASPLLVMEGISAGFNGQAVIHDIHLEFYPGEFLALVGDNGAGKSTLAMVAAGLLKPQSGRVRFENGSKPRPGLDVALLFQDPQEQLFTDAVDEETAFGPGNYDCFDPALHTQILHEADLWDLRSRRPLALSVGQQQRTALAACLSLRDLAEKTGLTASFLSQVERKIYAPSLNSLRKIADALEVPLLYFLEDTSKVLPVVRADIRPRIDLEHATISFQLLTPDIAHKMEAVLGKLSSCSENVVRPLSVPTEEFIYVLTGTLKVGIDDTIYILNTGDTIYFEGPHLKELSCGSDEDTTWISVITPPVF